MEDIDLKLYMQAVERLRIYSAALVDEFGLFIYYNKLAKEHYEGSLNNLKTRSIFDLMIPESREGARSRFRESKHSQAFRCVIYSKNTKRKYLRLAVKSFSKEDIYYRFLKGLSCRVRPIRVHFNSDSIELNGNWVPGRLNLD